MAVSVHPLDDIRVATPCRADWERMQPRDASGAVRHCQSCHKNVYNLSLMSSYEATALIERHEGNLCVRFARRADGTLVTGDCPVGAAMKRRRRGWTIAAILAAVIPSPVSAMLKQASAATLRASPVFSALENTPAGNKLFTWLEPPAAITPNYSMGAMTTLNN
jgi:hypothetical protein